MGHAKIDACGNGQQGGDDTEGVFQKDGVSLYWSMTGSIATFNMAYKGGRRLDLYQLERSCLSRQQPPACFCTRADCPGRPQWSTHRDI